MKKFIVVACVISMSVPVFAQMSKLEARLNAAKDVLNGVMSIPDKQIPESILSQATCVAVVPSLVKGAFIFGAEYGQGVATCRTGARKRRRFCGKVSRAKCGG